VTSALEGIGWSAQHPGRFTPGKDPVPIAHEAGWAGLDRCEKSRSDRDFFKLLFIDVSNCFHANKTEERKKERKEKTPILGPSSP
jgi:hypothetical protein